MFKEKELLIVVKEHYQDVQNIIKVLVRHPNVNGHLVQNINFVERPKIEKHLGSKYGVKNYL
jgi:DNA polymerase elongation subunit (family B)